MAGGVGVSNGRLLPRPPGRAAVAAETGRWSFWADAIVPPHVPLGPVAVTSFTCSWQLSGFGHGEAVVPVDQGRGGMTRADLLRLWGWRLWASYEDRVVWCGVPTDADDEGGAAVAVALTELPGYLVKRQWDVARTYTQIEQTIIAEQIAAPVADVGVTIARQPGAGFLRDRTYEYLEHDRAELLSNLSQVISGPEFRADYAMGPAGRPVCTLRIAYPRVGGATGLGITVPAGAVSYHAKWTGSPMRTRTYAVGDLPDNAAANATKPVVMRDRPQPGLPRLDEADDWPGVVVVRTLEDRADTNAAIYAAPALELAATMPASLPALGSYGVGDDVSVTLSDPLLPGALSASGRLVKAEANAAAGTVAWTVTITSPPPRPADSLAAMLAVLRSGQVGAWRRNLTTPPEQEQPR